MANLKLGRLPRRFDTRIPHMSAILRGAALPPPPACIDQAALLGADLGMMRNDTIGDCTCAAYYHALQVWSSHCNRDGLTITEPDGDVLKLYEEACGFDPNNPTVTDQGGVEQNVLAFLLNTGAPTGPSGESRHKLAAYVEVDPKNTDDVKRTIADCGVCYIGFNVPNYLMDGGAPALWDVQPSDDNSIVGGHAVVLTGYDAQALDLISWGAQYRMTWAFFGAFVDEAYALADYDWVTTKKTTPAGLSLNELRALMQALKAPA